jgi:hypothetical protein
MVREDIEGSAGRQARSVRTVWIRAKAANVQ